jgi:hypothetical protein
MSIEITDKTVGLWFTGLNINADWLGCLAELPSGKFEIKYRFRYHEDDKHFDSADRRSWYKGTTSLSREEAIKAIREMVANLNSAGGDGPVYEVMMDDGGPEVFLERLTAMPFAQKRLFHS